jgi:sulfofructose kinase
MAKIVCVGLACLDYLFRVEELPQGGGKFFATNYVAAPGGPAAAASLAVASLGHDAVFFGRLGSDAIGDDIIQRLEDGGVDAENVKRIPGKTSQVSSVIIDYSGERQIVNFSSSELDSDPSWLPEDIIKRADFLLTDVRWSQGARHALQLAQKYDIPSLIDADISPIDISDLVQLASHIVFSEKGLEQITSQKQLEGGLRQVHKATNAFVAVTVGDKGSYWLENEQVCHCPAQKIDAVDTCGAGDVFHGAFAVGKVEHMSYKQVMHFASTTASLKCLQFGGSNGVPDRSQVDQILSD